MKLGLEGILLLVERYELGEVYDTLSYDYATEIEYQTQRKNEVARALFLRRIAWSGEPTSIEIRRLFNQINSFAAERWAMGGLSCPVADFLRECNSRILFRQGKLLGARRQNIEFGVRMDLDVLDPLRQFKYLRGCGVDLIDDALQAWAEAVDAGPGSEDLALALTMALIAIHPFIDGNGRLGRIAYTWLRGRWHLPSLWLAEDAEGEVLRTGHGLASTEHLMATVMLRMCGGHNRVDFGREAESDVLALEILRKTLAEIRGDASLIATKEFQRLREHLRTGGHFLPMSPRFASLRSVLCS